jgi:predicted amidohydrolase
MRRGLAILAGLSAASSAYFAWSLLGRRGPKHAVEARIDDFALVGDLGASHSGAGNLLAVQPAVEPADFASAERLHDKLDAYLRDATERGALNAKTLVIFPEHIGTWFVAAHEKRRVYEAPDLARAATLICASNLPLFGREYLRALSLDKATTALFTFKAEVIARSYEAVFSTLATQHKCAIVAGSVVLPDPGVADGRVIFGEGALAEASFVFGSHGKPLAEPTLRCFPDPYEAAFTQAGDPEDLPVYRTPVGRVGVLLGRDAFQPSAHDALRRRGIDVLAVPAYLSGHQAWTQPWTGTAGADLPPDVDPADIGRITEAEAWLKWGPPARLSWCGARAQATTFLKGRLWDRPTDGAVLASANGKAHPGPLVENGSWVSLALEGAT